MYSKTSFFTFSSLTDTEWNIYSDWSDYLLDTQGDVHIHGVIYLRADPEVSHARLNKRSRSEEKGLTLEYLQQLHNKHEAWLHHKNVEKHESLYDVPILELDCNKDFESDAENREALFAKVKTFIIECHADNLRRRKEAMEADKENRLALTAAGSSSNGGDADSLNVAAKRQRLSFESEPAPSSASEPTILSPSKEIRQKMGDLPFEGKEVDASVFGPSGDLQQTN